MSPSDLWLREGALGCVIYLNTSRSLPFVSEYGLLTFFLNFSARCRSLCSALARFMLQGFLSKHSSFLPSSLLCVIMPSICTTLFIFKALHKRGGLIVLPFLALLDRLPRPGRCLRGSGGDPPAPPGSLWPPSPHRMQGAFSARDCGEPRPSEPATEHT